MSPFDRVVCGEYNGTSFLFLLFLVLRQHCQHYVEDYLDDVDSALIYSTWIESVPTCIIVCLALFCKGR